MKIESFRRLSIYIKAVFLHQRKIWSAFPLKDVWGLCFHQNILLQTWSIISTCNVYYYFIISNTYQMLISYSDIFFSIPNVYYFYQMHTISAGCWNLGMYLTWFFTNETYYWLLSCIFLVHLMQPFNTKIMTSCKT